MDSPRATLLFAAAFAAVMTIGFLESNRSVPVSWAALIIVLLTVVASIAFWIASRKLTYRWYSAPSAAIATVILVITVHHWLIQSGRVTALASALAALILVPIVLARVLAEQKFPDNASPLPGESRR